MKLTATMGLMVLLLAGLACKKSREDAASAQLAGQPDSGRHFELVTNDTSLEAVVRQCYLIIKHYGPRLGIHSGDWMGVCEAMAAVEEPFDGEQLRALLALCSERVERYARDQEAYQDEAFRKVAAFDVFRKNCQLLGTP